jgi:hypothetical protein
MHFIRRFNQFKRVPTRPLTSLSQKLPKMNKFLVVGSAIAGGAILNYSVANFSAACAAPQKEAAVAVDPFANSALYPPIKAFEKGTLKVSDIHTIAYSQYGNPEGKPVLVVHGGPGAGTNPNMARFFDPQDYRIILVDQRGCGESTPFANLQDNTTYDSVRDFEKIREKLKIDKWQIFGGSWGSTLGLAYAVSDFLNAFSSSEHFFLLFSRLNTQGELPKWCYVVFSCVVKKSSIGCMKGKVLISFSPKIGNCMKKQFLSRKEITL